MKKSKMTRNNLKERGPNPSIRLILFIIAILLIGSFLTPDLVKAASSSSLAGVPVEGTLPFKSRTLSEGSSTPIVMEYSYGYDFYGKYGRQLPISARITNSNKDFKGWLEVTTPLVERGSVYRQEINILSGESTDISMSIPLIGGYGQVDIRLVDDSGSLILEETNPIKLGNYEKILYGGILTDKPEGTQYIDSLAIKTFSFNEETFPSEDAYLDVLDIIIINDFDTSLLSKSQVEALRQWVLQGGSLVLGTGEHGDKVALPIAEEFNIGFTRGSNDGLNLYQGSISDHINEEYIEELKVKILRIEEERNLLRTQIINKNRKLQSYNNPLIPLEDIPGSDWPSSNIDKLHVADIRKTINNLSLNPSEEPVIYSKLDLGRGKIVLYNLDLSSSDISEKDRAAYENVIVFSIMDNLSYNKRVQIDREVDHSLAYGAITSSMSYTDTENIPRVHNYAIIIIIYIIIIGPVSYLVLRKKDKTELVWIVVPVLAIVFTFVIYLGAGETRVDKPFLGYVDIRLYRQDEIVEDELYFSLTAPYNNNYTLEINKAYPNMNLIEFEGDYPTYYQHQVRSNPRKYTAAVNYRQEETILEVNNNPAFRPVYFHNSSRYRGSNPIKAQINYRGDKIGGTITNTSNYTISNAVYIGDSFVFNLGSIDGGQTINLEDVDKVLLSNPGEISTYAIADRVFQDTEKQSKSLISRSRDVLSYLVNTYVQAQPDNDYIIGFTKDSEDRPLVKEISKEIDSYGTKAILSQVDVDYTLDSKEFVPDISNLTSKEGANNFKNVLVDEETIIEYYFPEGDEVVSLEYYALANRDYLSDYNKPFVGEVYALNYKRGEFDYIFSANTSKNEDTSLLSQENIKDYLSKDNVLTLKYKASFSHVDSIMLLPNISYWKEAK